ncbi:Tetracyclin repressor, C-terminal all-alpha domain [Rhodococcoides kyotonense]|uniref:Tetracyclin repressor, C-terminal all-alpha domain n=1 Tax=Rhodococcoides kyotonense TaxID=398843 RepID=A0A239HX12_9NOCA|nr:Tetracyclin repressor, C-terminal all-alpha domain [Rhodococcus kyotonensis]
MTREQIVAAAKAQLESGGVDGFSMRSLASDVGVSPMAIYRHVGDREQLLSLVLDEVSTSFPSIELPEDPRERIRTLIGDVFDVLASDRWIADVLRTGNRGGAGALWLVDRILGAATELGMTPSQGMIMYRALWNYTLGAILNLSATAPRPDSDPSPMTVRVWSIGAGQLPNLVAAIEDRPDAATKETYMQGIDFLVDGYVRA